MMMTLCHIFQDEKFVKVAIDEFEQTSYHHRYVCLREENESSPYKYIESLRGKVSTIQPNQMYTLLNDNTIDVFCFHTLDASRYEYVMQIPLTKTIIWFAWGYDLYTSLGDAPAVYPMEIYQPLTKAYLGLIPKTKREHIAYKIKRAVKWLIFPNKQYSRYKAERVAYKKQKKAIELQRSVLQRVDYISTVLKMEYDLLRESNILQAKFFHFQYGLGLSYSGCPIINPDDAQYILVGNSADPANNHLDVLQILRDRKINNTIYMPLAYCAESYRDMLMRKMRHDNIIFQTDFCDISTYRQRLLHCRVAVFGHLRQQAMGNVNACLRQGSKVFLYEDSMVYKHLKSQGFTIYSIGNDLTPESINELMTFEEIQHNRELLDKNRYSIQALQHELDVVQQEIE